MVLPHTELLGRTNANKKKNERKKTVSGTHDRCSTLYESERWRENWAAVAVVVTLSSRRPTCLSGYRPQGVGAREDRRTATLTRTTGSRNVHVYGTTAAQRRATAGRHRRGRRPGLARGERSAGARRSATAMTLAARRYHRRRRRRRRRRPPI